MGSVPGHDMPTAGTEPRGRQPQPLRATGARRLAAHQMARQLMLSYRHAFHAGNFADTLKHGLLAAVLTYCRRKPAPLLYLDTHAGAADYPLTGTAARTTGEAAAGIVKLWARDDWPDTLLPYRETLAALQRGQALTHYPGSAKLAAHLLGRRDRLSLYELHPDDHGRLARGFRDDARAVVTRADGLQALRRELPPPQRRGVILIDPPWERHDEYTKVPDALGVALERFATGVYLLWYPLIKGDPAAAMRRRLKPALTRPTLRVELSLAPDGPGMTGCGMLVVNPPWTLPREAGEAVHWLASVLGGRNARGRVVWEVTEQDAAQRR